MTNTPDHGPARTQVASLRELDQNIPPPRDLWAGIEARITTGRRGDSHTRVSRFRSSRPRLLACAAIVGALAVGVWVGRSALPGSGVTAPPTTAANHVANQHLLTASFMTNPAYLEQRAALVASFEAQLRTLPPETRDNVAASLSALRKSMEDIQAALGREPGNALLQELLVNICQDEMRVLTALHEAGDVRKEI